jgi:putative hydrolase of the HAD superfamily
VVTFGVVFDLDDTLYLEGDYVRSGFRAVAADVAIRAPVSEDEVFNVLWSGYLRGVRGSSFEVLVEELGDAGAGLSVPDLITVYRSHSPVIHLMEGMEALLTTLRSRDMRLGVISDGYAVSQRMKVDALDLGRLVDHVILTDDLGREYWKPHQRAYIEVSRALEIPPNRLVYVGDNPAKDFTSPGALGWRSIRLQLPGQLHGDAKPRAGNEPTAVVLSVGVLAETLEVWTNGDGW